jgi:hypothetical protein
MEDEEELENGDDEEIQARKKLLKLLEQGDNDDDDEDGVAIEYNSGEEGVAPAGSKENKGLTANGKAANENGDLEEDDDDIMGDEY